MNLMLQIRLHVLYDLAIYKKNGKMKFMPFRKRYKTPYL